MEAKQERLVACVGGPQPKLARKSNPARRRSVPHRAVGVIRGSPID